MQKKTEDSLKHFNPYHDKLGRFAKSSAGSPTTPKGYTKALNKVERQYVLNKGESLRLSRKRNAHEQKRHKYDRRIAKANDNIRRSKEMQLKYLDEIAKNNEYDLFVKNTHQSSQRGRDFANAYAGFTLLGGAGAGAAVVTKNYKQRMYYGNRYGGDIPSRIKAYKYKVRYKDV